MVGLAASDQRLDAALPEQSPVLVVVVAAIGDQAIGTAARSTDGARDCGHRVEERDQLGDVVAVAAGERERERDTAAVDEEVVLGAGTASINRARARLGTPFFAWTWLESAI